MSRVIATTSLGSAITHPDEEHPVNTNAHTRHQRTMPGLVRRILLSAAAGFVITAAAFATVAVLLDQFQLSMTYGETSDTSIDAVGR
jgi:hypothetical protein